MEGAISGLAINLKFEAERLLAKGGELLDVAKQLSRIASAESDPRIAGELLMQAQSIVKIAEDVSDMAPRLVDR